MIFILFVLVSFGSYWCARMVFRERRDLALFAAPALLIGTWTIAVVFVVQHMVPLHKIWLGFWLATAASTTIGIAFALRERARLDIPMLVTAAAASLVLMAPYLLHGFANFPGSYFWDGFTYMAAGESLWDYPRNSATEDIQLFYQLGQSFAKTRYISSSLIALMKGIFPAGGDAQAAMGYYLLLCVFTFAMSCAFLAKAAMPGRRLTQLLFVVVATISGPVLNLIWANNYDHLLAASIAPVLIGQAFVLRWSSAVDAVVFGLFSAVLLYIYPEMAPIFALPAYLILFVRLLKEPRSMAMAKCAAIAAATITVLVIPVLPDLVAFMQKQFLLATMALSAEARPGNGYFPTFFSKVCGPAAWFGLFQPYAQCDYNLSHYTKLAVSVACWSAIGAAMLSWRRNAALAIAAAAIFAASAFFLIVQHYDYGAFKILETGWITVLLLTTLWTVSAGRMGKVATVSVAVLLVTISISRIVAFERWVKERSIVPFAQLQHAVPGDSAVEVRVEDSLAFEWATYYLRNHAATYTKGELLYLPASQVKTVSDAGKLDRPQYMLSDKALSGIPAWTNGKFYLYKK